MARSDRQLLDAYSQGETAAFEELVRRHDGPLLGYLTRLCGNRDRAEDCWQETFKRMIEKTDKIHGDNLKGWLFRVGTNVAMDGFRQRVIRGLGRPGVKRARPSSSPRGPLCMPCACGFRPLP